MKPAVKWILVLLAMITVLALAAGTAGAEVERTLQLQIPLPSPRKGGATVSGPGVDSPVTCTEYTFTVNNGTDTGVASYSYTVGLLEGSSYVADTLYKSEQTEDSTFSYTFYLPGRYALFVNRYDSNDAPVGGTIFCTFSIADGGNHAANPLYAKIAEIVSGLSGTAWDKALSLHDWLTHNAYYDGQFQYYGPDGVLLHGRGVCNSYARAYMLLCEAAGIPVHRVTGIATNSSGHSENHAWNAIELDGNWYLVDVTWDDPYTSSSAAVSGSERYDYFCLNDDLMGLNHENDGSLFASGQCNSLAMNYLVRTEDSLGMGDWILNAGQEPNLYTDRITARLEQGETAFSVPCEDTLYVRINGSSSYYRYTAGSPDAIRRWTLLAFWMSENGFELEGSDGADPVQVPLSVSYDRAANAFVCCEPEPPVPELNYTVRTDSGDLPENGTVEPGQWLTVTFGEDPEIPGLEEYETSYSLFLCSGSPDGSHRQIGHLAENENGEYAFPAVGGAGNYYVQIWGTIMVPSGDGYSSHSTIKEYFEFVIGEGSGEALPGAALFFPNVADGSLAVGQKETLRAYMTGAEHIAVRTETEDGQAVPTIGFDGFAGAETWCAEAPGIYTLTLTGYTYDDDGALIAIPDRTVSCTVTVGTPSWNWSYEEGEQMISITGSGTLAVNGTAPWLGKGYEIRRILIDAGITRIGTGVFAGLDGKVRIDFQQNVLPEFLGDAFGETSAVCRYLSEDVSWVAAPASESVRWIWMPTFHFQGAGTFDSLWYEKDGDHPGWSVTVNADGEPETFMDMPAATAHELVGYCHDVCLNAVPAGEDLAVLNGVESDLWYLYFESDCAGSLALNSANCSAMPLSISVLAPNLNLTVTCAETCAGEDSLRELTVTDGVVDYTGNTEKLLLKNTSSGHTASVTVRGTVGDLAYYAEGSAAPYPYRGTLTVTGGITGGLVYNGWDGTMAIHGVTDAYPLGGAPEQQFGPLTGLENLSVILYDETNDASFLNPEIDTEGGIVPTLDMFRLRYILDGQGNNFLMMTPLEGAGIGSEVIEIRIDDYNATFLDDLQGNIVWGSETELYVDGADITLPGSGDGKGLGELGAGKNSTVTVQCPVENLFFQPDPWQRNHITFYIEGPVASAYLQPNNCMLDLTLRNGGSIGSGRWKQLLRDYRNFGPRGTGAGETVQVVKDSALLVMSWNESQEYASILPSDTVVSDAAGTLAMAELTDTELTQQELDALAAVSDGNAAFALDPSKIAWVFDVSVNAYSVDESGSAAKGAAIGDLGGNAIPIQISNPTGNPNVCVIRLHEENGVLTARKLDAAVTEDEVRFASDLFSTYLLAEAENADPQLNPLLTASPASIKVRETAVLTAEDPAGRAVSICRMEGDRIAEQIDGDAGAPLVWSFSPQTAGTYVFRLAIRDASTDEVTLTGEPVTVEVTSDGPSPEPAVDLPETLCPDHDVTLVLLPVEGHEALRNWQLSVANPGEDIWIDINSGTGSLLSREEILLPDWRLFVNEKVRLVITVLENGHDATVVEKEWTVTDHVWDEGTVTVPATCTEDGEILYTCIHCGETKTEWIDRLGHDYHGTTVKEPTCEERGEILMTCSRCGDSWIRYTDALYHDWDEGTVTVPATCTEEGEILYHCTRCDKTKTEVIPAPGHAWSEDITDAATCQHPGKIYHVCEACGEQEILQELEQLDHIWGDEQTDEPTCQHPGKIYHVCEACGEQEILQELEQLSHIWNDGILVHAPTSQSEGIIRYTCRVGGETRDESMPKLEKDPILMKLPAAVTVVEEAAFEGGAVEGMIIPAGCGKLEARAFAGCDSLMMLRFEGADTEIADDAVPADSILWMEGPEGSTAQAYAQSHGILFLVR